MREAYGRCEYGGYKTWGSARGMSKVWRIRRCEDRRVADVKGWGRGTDIKGQ